MNKKTVEGYTVAIDTLKKIIDYKDSSELSQKCVTLCEDLKEKNAIDKKNSQYEKALNFMKRNNIKDYKDAMGIFKSLSGWKDSEAKIAECQENINMLNQQEAKRREDELERKKILDAKRALYDQRYPAHREKPNLQQQIHRQKAELDTLIKQKNDSEKVSKIIKGFCGICFGAGAFGAIVGFATNTGGLATFGLIYGIIMGALLFLALKSSYKQDKTIAEKRNHILELEKRLFELESIPSFEEFLKEEKING